MPPAGEPNVEGENDRTVLSIRSKSNTCVMAETSVDSRKVDVEDVGRTSGGTVWAQFHPQPLKLALRSNASHKVPEK